MRIPRVLSGFVYDVCGSITPNRRMEGFRIDSLARNFEIKIVLNKETSPAGFASEWPESKVNRDQW